MKAAAGGGGDPRGEGKTLGEKAQAGFLCLSSSCYSLLNGPRRFDGKWGSPAARQPSRLWSMSLQAAITHLSVVCCLVWGLHSLLFTFTTQIYTRLQCKDSFISDVHGSVYSQVSAGKNPLLCLLTAYSTSAGHWRPLHTRPGKIINESIDRMINENEVNLR